MIHSRVLLGLNAQPVNVECHVSAGLPSTTIVGLPEGAVREARDRIRSAITNSGFNYPDGRIVINLAPGHLAKSGSFLDLPMAISVLCATGEVSSNQLSSTELLGELSLFGELRRARGVLSCALAAQQDHRRLLLPTGNADECHLLSRDAIGLVENLAQTAAVLNGGHPWPSPNPKENRQTFQRTNPWVQIIGQQGAKRALTVAAAGGHHALLVGPPGTGKSLLSQGFAELLPDLDEQAALQVAAVFSVAGQVRDDHHRPPFRAPHHSASAQALVGGGRHGQPGEISLAHHGVLFLDEVPHFKPSVLNLLREPIETGEVTLARADYRRSFPCNFQLIAAMNPCPKGQTCREDACRCSPAQVQSYQGRLSGPLLDRIDIQVQVPPVPQDLLLTTNSEPAADFAPQIQLARDLQLTRQGKVNAALTPAELSPHIQQAQGTDTLVEQMARRGFSARSFHKVWRLARTAADLSNEKCIASANLAEALTYRALDWERGV